MKLVIMSCPISSNTALICYIPLGVLAHSTHVRGDDDFINGIELPRARVTLATKLPPEDCANLHLAIQNPAEIDIHALARSRKM